MRRALLLLPAALVLLAGCSNTQGSVLKASDTSDVQDATPVELSDEAPTDKPADKYVCCRSDLATKNAKSKDVSECRIAQYDNGKVEPTLSCGSDESAVPFTDPRTFADKAACETWCFAD